MTDQGGGSQAVRGIYEDMLATGAATPPELRAPLAPLKGERPPAPDWFRAALAQEPERSLTATPQGAIETLTWGERGKPGLLFVHGNGAHADWWSFIAPMFADRYRVAAMSKAGMGDSDLRQSYTLAGFAEDAQAVCEAAGLNEGGRKPVYIGHSAGGGHVFYVACRQPERLHSAILIDVAFLKRLDGSFGAGNTDLGPRQGPLRVYPTLEAALARFRLSPPQPTENLYVVDFIARRSLRRAPLPDGPGEGWTWRFDPDLWARTDRAAAMDFFASSPRVGVPAVHLYGQHSLMKVAGVLKPPADDAPLIEIPEAYHHVMIDQPLALATAIRAQLAVWGI